MRMLKRFWSIHLVSFIVFEIPTIVIFYFITNSAGFIQFLLILVIFHIYILGVSMDDQLSKIKEDTDESQRTLKNMEEEILKMQSDIWKIPRS